jgi:hypothetical protein
MGKMLCAAIAALFLAGAAAGCVVREQRVAEGPRGCRGGAWVDGHYGPRGRWHPGHWRCPGAVEEVEID